MFSGAEAITVNSPNPFPYNLQLRLPWVLCRASLVLYKYEPVVVILNCGLLWNCLCCTTSQLSIFNHVTMMNTWIGLLFPLSGESWYVKVILLLFRADYMQRVELIQDLRFETATTKIKATPDGEFLIASGDLMQPLITISLRSHYQYDWKIDREINACL